MRMGCSNDHLAQASALIDLKSSRWFLGDAAKHWQEEPLGLSSIPCLHQFGPRCAIDTGRLTYGANCLLMPCPPVAHGQKNGLQGEAIIGQPILHLRGHLRIDLPLDHTIGLEFA